MFEIYDNFLEKEVFKTIQSKTIGPNAMPWYYTENLSGNGVEENCYFTHLFFNNNARTSEWFSVIEPIVFILDCKSLVRIKANLYPRTENLVHHKNHVDYEFDHTAAIFYLNTNDGFTVINDEHKIESIENRLLVFDPQVIHHSTNCTDNHFRANINFNYF